MLLLLIMILVLLVPASARADGGSGAWPQFQNDLYNDGVTTDTAPLSAPAAAWEQQVGNVAMSGVDAAPLVAGGQVFVLDALGKVWDFDARTGTQVWATQLSSTGMKFQLATPAYDSGTLYVATNDGHVYALDAAGGNILWQVALPLAAYSQLNSPVKYDSGKLYVGAWNSNASTDEYYYCLNAATGQPGIGTQYQLPNSASPGGYYWAGACIAGNDLVFGSENSTLTCLDKDNGTLLDSVSLQVYNSGAQQVRSSVSYDPATGLVFLTDQATTAGCCWAFSLDAASGKLTPNWHTQLGFSTSTPAVYGGRVYVGTGIYSIQGGLYCLDEASGSVVWKFLPTTGGGAASVPGVQASPVISVQNSTPYIYFPTICEHSTVYCLDQNGNQVWQFNDTDSTYTLQGVAAASGWLYFGNDAGWVYALQTPGAPAPAAGATVRFLVGQSSYYAGDRPVAMDAAPFISGGRLLAPVRYLADALGAQTVWDGASQTVTISKGGVVVELVIGSTSLLVNNVSEQMDAAPVITGGRTYLPARYVAEAMGYQVAWDASSGTVTLSPRSS